MDICFCTDWLYCFLFMILCIQLSFIFNLSCYYTHCLYARALSFSYTLIRSLLTILNLHVHIMDMLYFSDQVFDKPEHVERSLEFLLFDSGILASFLFFFLYFSWFLYIRFGLYFSSLFIWYHAWMLLCDITVIVDLL